MSPARKILYVTSARLNKIPFPEIALYLLALGP
jgi:hypothetical protein